MKIPSKSTLLLIGILLFGFAIRFFKISEVPTALYIDEVAMYVDVKSILNNGTDIHGNPWYQLIFPSYGDYKMPVYIWLATFSAAVLGLSEISLKMPTLLAGVATALVGYLLSKELLTFQAESKTAAKKQSPILLETIALSVAALITISPWSIIFSRAAFEGHLAQLFFGISILLQLVGMRKKSLPLLCLAVLSGVVATYTYYSVRFVWVGVSSFLWLIYIRRFYIDLKQTNFKWVGAAVFASILYFVLLIPLQRSPFYGATDTIRLNTQSILTIDDQVHTINAYRLYAGNSFIDRVIFNSYTFTARELIMNYSDHLSLNFLFLHGDPNLRHGTGKHGVFLLPTVVFFLLGLFTLIKKQKSILGFLSVWIVLAFLPASVPENTPHALRSLNALLPFAVILGVGLADCITALTTNRSYVIKGVTSLLLLLTVLSFTEFYRYYFYHYRYLSRADWFTHFSEIATKIEAERTENQPVFVSSINDKFFLWLLYKGEYLERGLDIQKENQFVLEEFNGIHIGKLPTEAVSGTIIATTKEQWQNYTTKNPEVKVASEDEITAEDGTTYIVAQLL
jgi:4-amino-4-deoxy-L-arabinose transferase-like glycosyltransferase